MAAHDTENAFNACQKKHTHKKKNTGGRYHMIERRKLLQIASTGIAASMAMPFIGRTGWAASPTYTLKLTFADTQNHPLYEVLKRFSENVRKRTSGAVDIQVFSIGQLGSGTNIMTGLQTGIIDFCAHTSGFIDTVFPKFQVVDLPFLFPDATSAERLLDGPIGSKLLEMMPAKGIYGLGYGHWGWRVVSTIDRKVAEPEDISRHGADADIGDRGSRQSRQAQGRRQRAVRHGEDRDHHQGRRTAPGHIDDCSLPRHAAESKIHRVFDTNRHAERCAHGQGGGTTGHRAGR